MAIYLGLLIFSFITTGILIVPFIDLLYKLSLVSKKTLVVSGSTSEQSAISKIDRQNSWKIGTPVGAGILLIAVITILYSILFPLTSRLGIYVTSLFSLKEELHVIFFTFFSFGLLGLYDDIAKIFNLPVLGIFGFNVSHKTVFQVMLSTTVAFLLKQNLGIEIINLPFFGVIHLGLFYIPLATATIFGFTRSIDIADGLDGLASGCLLIALLSIWVISVTSLDTPLSMFISLWIGALTAFLYFNVYPARIWLGNAGSLAFGSTLAVTGLILGKVIAVVVIGGVFVVEGMAHLIQLISIKLFKKKILPITPIHYFLQSLGWLEPKIVMRFWLAGIIFSIFGLWLAGI